MAAVSGAQILLSCVASPRGNTSAEVPSEVLWRTVNRSHAVTLKLVNVFANRVGPEAPHEFWGGSHVINTDGRFLLNLEHDHEAVATVDIDLEDIGRQRYRFPYLRDERLDLTLRELQRVAAARWEGHTEPITSTQSGSGARAQNPGQIGSGSPTEGDLS
jgi:predicted amidohydrolase